MGFGKVYRSFDLSTFEIVYVWDIAKGLARLHLIISTNASHSMVFTNFV
jgi:hypothetical protein